MFKNKDYMSKLVSYIKSNLKKGYTKESLLWALVEQGYSKRAVEKALDIVDKELARQAPILKEKPVIRYEIIEPKKYAMTITKNESFWKKLLRKLFS